MLLINSIKKEETCGLCDALSRDRFFYKNSIVKVVGWETPVSVFYKEGRYVKMRFKKSLKFFEKDFSDTPYGSDPSCPLYYIQLEKYKSERYIRQIRYAVEEFKKSGFTFEATPLVPAELKRMFEREGYLHKEEFVLNDDSTMISLFDADCLWCPVDVDAIITGYTNRDTMCSEDAMLVYWDGRVIHGKVGFDSRFYDTGTLLSLDNDSKVYELTEGVRESEKPWWIDNYKLRTTIYFLRDYIVAPDNICYSYDGKELAYKTRHHKNVAFMNDLIRLLCKRKMRDRYIAVHLQATIPDELTRFELDDVERIIVPHLATQNALDERALKRFLALKTIIKKAGFKTEFQTQLRNILELNGHRECGGSGRGMCSEKLLANLNKLHKKAGNERMAVLLCDFDLLKKEVACINGR